MAKDLKLGSRRKSLLISSLIILIGLIFYMVILRPEQQYYNAHYVKINGTYLLHPLPIQNFELIDNHNNTFTKANLKNHWSLLFFGFTHCEMVCPTTLSALNKMYQILEKTLPRDKLPQVIFITVDPQRDTVATLNNYVSQFNPHFVGARTTAIDALEKQFHIVSEKSAGNGGYNHSTDVLLVNPEAKIQAYFSYPSQAENLVKDYNSIISKSS